MAEDAAIVVRLGEDDRTFINSRERLARALRHLEGQVSRASERKDASEIRGAAEDLQFEVADFLALFGRRSP